MSSTPPSGGRVFVEPLEARVAPAGLIGKANAPAFSTDPNYLSYSTQPSTGHLGFVDASSTYGINAPGTFALAMSGAANGQAGDQLFIFNQIDGFGPGSIFLRANAKSLVAFFQDKNGDGEVQTNELVGLALGKKSDVNVNGTVDGDIVANLNGDNTLGLTGVNKASFKINALTVQNVNGNIIAGGNISNVTINGSVNNVLAGTAAFGTPFHFAGSNGPITGTIQGGAYKDNVVGASVNNLSLNALAAGGRIQAGDGGLGALGGSVNGVQLLGDTNGFLIQGGAGGVGNDAVKGGLGGAVTDVLVRGVANTAVNTLITIQGGVGGANDVGKGGGGGSVSGIFTSFDSSNVGANTGIQSADLLSQNLLIRGGAGGQGLKGGNGGSVLASNFNASIPDDGAATAEIQILGGEGGVSLDGSKGGNGGGVSTVSARNLDPFADALNSTILLQGGNGGAKKGGGSVDNVTLLGQSLSVNGGNGGDGNKGGNGGSLTGVTIANQTNLFAHSLTLNGGQGGNGANRGGAGGDIATVAMADSDLSALTINSGTHGNGGNGANGAGGQGGSVRDLRLADSNASGVVALVNVRTGIGGNGQTGGGAGGDVEGFTITGTGFTALLTAGVGGSVNGGGTGNGGAGGNLLSVNISNLPELDNVTLDPTTLAAQTVVVAAGAGGNGAEAGGAGGAVDTVNVFAGGAISLTAGNGGNGGSGAAGAGGASNTSGANSLTGSVNMLAGSGGLTGGAPGDGGTITGFVSSAANNIVLRAGDGHAGGAGGSVLNSGTGFNQLTGLPSAGGLEVRAGAGDASGSSAGAGGSIDRFFGQVSQGGLTSFTAGNGGGVDGSARVGAGGSVSNVQLTGSSDPDSVSAQTVTIDAGSAGVSGASKKGAVGGSVNEITLYNLDAGTVVHHVAAGDGSAGVKKGGAGGSLDGVFVGTVGDAVAEIGVLSGARYGYALDQAGGLFAGLGGGGRKVSGLNGSVSNVTAIAISSIVAGKGSRPGLVESIDGIDLEGGTVLRANANGSYFNYDTANFVGSTLDPNAAGASTFKYDANGPIDGIIAVRNLPTNINFALNAVITTDFNDPNLIVLNDYQQPNPVPVTIPAPATLYV